ANFSRSKRQGRAPAHTYATYRRRIVVTAPFDELTRPLHTISSTISRDFKLKTARRLYVETFRRCPFSPRRDSSNDFLTNDRFETIASSSTSATMNGLVQKKNKSRHFLGSAPNDIRER
ncbi:hypothetical protein X777_07391, partial [Ooceraea biroi]